MTRVLVLCVLFTIVAATVLAGQGTRQNPGATQRDSPAGLTAADPPPPVAPDVITRDASGRIDMEIAADGAVTNRDWNPVWELVTSRFDHGWSLEARIPFKSLRYQPGRDQIWGFQVRRMVRWKNEIAFISKIPTSIGERAH